MLFEGKLFAFRRIWDVFVSHVERQADGVTGLGGLVPSRVGRAQS